MEIFKFDQGLRIIESRINELYHGENIVFIGIVGGSCSGKGYISEYLRGKLNIPRLSMDDYYKSKDFIEHNNYDIPDSIELNLFENHLRELRRWETVEKPIFDFKTNTRLGYEKFGPFDKLVIEGLYCFFDEIKDLIDIKVFVDASEETRLNRRLERDVERVNSTREKITRRWDRDVEPGYLEFVKPQKKHADFVIKND